MSQKPKVMIVDDEKDNLDLLYRTLRREFQLFQSESPVEALTMLETDGEMAVIISDQSMPEMNGIEFLKQTKAIFPDSKRILLTGYSEDSLKETGSNLEDAEVFSCVTKPWNPDELKNTIKDAIEKYHISKSSS